METIDRLASLVFGAAEETRISSLTLCEKSRIVIEEMVVHSNNKVWEGLEYYNYLLSIGDKRVEDWLLMKSPVPTILITMAYLLSKYVCSTSHHCGIF